MTRFPLAPKFDVAVVGAGLGGLCAAISLRNAGFSVALFEREEVGRHKVCGEFLSPESAPILRNLGIWDAMQNAGAVAIRGARVALGEKSSRALPMPGGGAGIGISRAVLDAILWNRARDLGVTLFPEFVVSRLEKREKGFEIEGGGHRFATRFAVAATGRNSALLPSRAPRTAPKFLGLKAHFHGVEIPHDEVQLFPFNGGYCGISRVEDGIFNVCALLRYRKIKGKGKGSRRTEYIHTKLWESVLAENAALARAMSGATPRFEWLATANVTFGNFRPVHGEILCVGDAAGYIHPLAGDGMAMALRSGELACAAIVGGEFPSEAARIYEQSWRREFGSRLRWAARLQPLMLRPKAALCALQMLDFAPVVGRKLVGLTRG